MKKPVCLSFATITRSSITLSAIALLFSTIAYSQSAPNPLFHHLPPKADHIYDINFAQLNTKGNLSAMLSAIPTGTNPHTGLVLAILKDPAAAGVDLANHILVAQTSGTGTGADTLSFTNILVQLSDSAKFRATLTKAFPDLHIHRLPGKGASAGQDQLGLAWNDRLLVMTLVAHENANPLSASTPHQPSTAIATEKSLTALAGFTAASPWLTDQRFLNGFATAEDAHFWSTGMNLGRFFAKLAAKMAAKTGGAPGMPNNAPGIPMSGFPAGPANTPILSTFNFAAGRIVFHMTTFNQPNDAATLKRFVDRPFNKDLIARLPDGLLLGWMAMRMNPTAYKDVLDRFHTRNLVDSMLAKKGLTVDDLTGTFGGDFLIAAVAPDPADATDTAKKKVNFYFVASINDPAKMLQLGSKISAAAANTDTTKGGLLKNFAKSMVIQDNLLVVSRSNELSRKYFSHTDRRPVDQISDDKDVQDLVIDLKAVSQFIGNSMGSDPKAMVAARIMEKLDKITFTNGAMAGDSMEATFQIVTAEPSTNSLATLMSILH